MKKSQLIFYSVLVLSILVFAACKQVAPGKAILSAGPVAAASCAPSEQPCGPKANNVSCCSGLICTQGICGKCQQFSQCDNTNTTLKTQLANCSLSVVTCQYGCSNGQCNPQPCKPLTCAGLKATCGDQKDGCGGILKCGTCPSGQVCQYGGCYVVANQTNQTCTPYTGCKGNYSTTLTSNCTQSTTYCQNGCNVSTGKC